MMKQSGFRKRILAVVLSVCMAAGLLVGMPQWVEAAESISNTTYTSGQTFTDTNFTNCTFTHERSSSGEKYSYKFINCTFTNCHFISDTMGVYMNYNFDATSAVKNSEFAFRSASGNSIYITNDGTIDDSRFQGPINFMGSGKLRWSVKLAGNGGNADGIAYINFGGISYIDSNSTLRVGTADITVPCTRTGYNCTGYSKASNTTVCDITNITTAGVVTANAKLSISQNCETLGMLYAQWTPKQYTVTLNNMGGTGGKTTVTATYNAKFSNLNATDLPTRDGYVFNGFYSATSGGTQYFNASGVATNIWTQDVTNPTIYAQWIKEIPITYDLNGGTLPNNAPYSYTSLNDTVLVAPTKTGYIFNGWTGSNGATPQKSVTISKLDTDNKSYTANWAAIQSNVTFDAQGGTGAPITIQVSYDGTYGNVLNTIPVYEGKSFKGWYDAISGGNQIKSTTDVKITSAQTLYAQWEDKGSVSVDVNRQIYKQDDIPKQFIITGTILNGFKIEYKEQSEDVFLETPIPTSEGIYDVKITRDEDSTYKKYETIISGGLIICGENSLISINNEEELNHVLSQGLKNIAINSDITISKNTIIDNDVEIDTGNNKLTVPSGVTLTNKGTIDGNIVNNGVIDGGKLKGTITNNGILINTSMNGTVNNTTTSSVQGGTIATGTTVNNGIIKGNVNNNGTLDNTTIDTDSTVNGGTVTGTTTNNGDINDVSIEGNVTNTNGIITSASIKENTTVSGGSVAGIIANAGTIENVTIDTDATVTGGSVAGGTNKGTITSATITGNMNNASGSLDNATISTGVTVTGGDITGISVNNGTLVDAAISGTIANTNGQIASTAGSHTTVADSAVVTGGTVDGNVENNGTLNNVVVLTGTEVTGGKVTGITSNAGTLTNTTISGTVTNGTSSSKINGGTIAANGSAIGGIIDGIVENNGTITNPTTISGTLTNKNSIIIETENTMEITGSLINTSGSTLTNSGTIDLSDTGKFDNQSGASVDNNGTMTIAPGADYTNDGDFSGTGSMSGIDVTINDSQQTVTYDGTGKSFDTTTSGFAPADDKYIISYSINTQATYEWTTTKPVDAGTYDVKLTRSGNILGDPYNELTETIIDDGLVIEKMKWLTPSGLTVTDNSFYTTNESEAVLNDGSISGITAEMEYSTDSGENKTYKTFSNTGTVYSCAKGTYYIRIAAQDDNHIASDYVTLEIGQGILDNTAPEVTIEVASNSWVQKLLNIITFGLFLKGSQTATITATDQADNGIAGCGVASYEYYVTNTVLTAETVKDSAIRWTNGSSVEVKADTKAIVYAKVTDKLGNVSFAGTDGLNVCGEKSKVTVSTEKELNDAIEAGLKNFVLENNLVLSSDTIIPTGVTIDLSGNTLNADSGKTIFNNGTISGGTLAGIVTNSGNIEQSTINADVTNEETITNPIAISGKIENQSGATIQNDKGITTTISKDGNITNSGMIEINGALAVNGTLTNKPTGSVANNGKITIDSSAKYKNEGKVTGTGELSDPNAKYPSNNTEDSSQKPASPDEDNTASTQESVKVDQSKDIPVEKVVEVTYGTGTVIITVENISDDKSDNEDTIPTNVILSSSKNVIDACLTADEKKAAENGESIEIRMTATMLNHSTPKEDQKLVEQAVSNQPGNALVLGNFINLVVEKKIGNGDWETLTELGDEIDITIGIPKDLQNEWATFYIVRVHEGETTILEDLDNDPATITIQTKLFSTYAIAYSIEDSKETATEDDNNKTTGIDEESAQPSTGNHIWILFGVMIALIVGGAVVIFIKKRNKDKSGKCS